MPERTIPYDTDSIAILRYPPSGSDRQPKGHASGFFVESEEYGPVCVTCAHVFHPEYHPGPDRTKIMVNGHLANLKFDAFEHYGIDIALVEIPPTLDTSNLTFHELGATERRGRAFYAHAWSPTVEEGEQLVFTKIWGARTKLWEGYDSRAAATHARKYKTWLLRNDIKREQPAQFDPTHFHQGWSGAPVFNVRERLDEHAVIGVVSIVSREPRGEMRREANAISIESLAFLKPKRRQEREARPVRARRSALRTLLASFMTEPDEERFDLAFEDDAGPGSATLASIATARFEETADEVVCPPVPWAPSPYDKPS